MFSAVIMSSLSEEASSAVSSGTRVQDLGGLNPMVQQATPTTQQSPPLIKIKKKRNLPGNPDPDAEVIALSPGSLLATNRFVCEVCKKGFQRDQNLQLHRRGHNLPWKLKQRNKNDNIIRKRAYVCPEPTCIHHHPSRALGDLTGIKKHFCRKHGEKKWKCDKCNKIYAVQSDWKAHSKTCGTKEYRCDCGTLFSRKDSFITHRAFCDALAEESARLSASAILSSSSTTTTNHTSINGFYCTQSFNLHPPNPSSLFSLSTQQQPQNSQISLNHWDPPREIHQNPNNSNNNNQNLVQVKPETIIHLPISSSPFYQEPPTHKSLMATSSTTLLGLPVSTQSTTNFAMSSASLSATALLQKAATAGHLAAGVLPKHLHFASESLPTSSWQKTDRFTRDFLGLNGGSSGGGGNGNGEAVVDVNVNVHMRNLLSFTGGGVYDRGHLLLKQQQQHQRRGFGETWENC